MAKETPSDRRRYYVNYLVVVLFETVTVLKVPTIAILEEVMGCWVTRLTDSLVGEKFLPCIATLEPLQRTFLLVRELEDDHFCFVSVINSE